MSAIEIKLYNTLKDKLGEKETELLLDYVRESVKDNLTASEAKGMFFTEDRARNLFATKEDVANAKNTIIVWTVSILFLLLSAQTTLLIQSIKSLLGK